MAIDANDTKTARDFARIMKRLLVEQWEREAKERDAHWRYLTEHGHELVNTLGYRIAGENCGE
jgi:hypothetical protein